MASQTEIVNAALGKIGAETRLSSIGENSKAGRAATAAYTVARDALLADHPWNFAMKRAALPRLQSVPVFGYAYEYQLPSDCLRLYEVGGFYVWELRPGTKAPYALEGGKILTDIAAPLQLRYVARVEDTASYSALFTEAFAWKLAVELAEPISGEKATRQLADRGYEAAIARARFVDGSENPPQDEDEDSWVMARMLP